MMPEDSDPQITLTKLLFGLLFALIWSFIAVWIVSKKKIVKTFPIEKTSPIDGENVLVGFGLYLFMQALIIPFFIGIIYFLFTGSPLLLHRLTRLQQVWMHMTCLLGTYISLAFYYFYHLDSEKKQAIFGNKAKGFKNFVSGVSTWFIAYPIALTINLIIQIFFLLVFNYQPVEQDVIELFRFAISNPPLLILMGLMISFVVPVAEEFLFRGLLQSWLKKRFKSPKTAIVLAASIFSSFHYSFSQGLSNIQILIVLFVLGCFLGYLYEKSQSIWTSIGLHSMFNTVTTLLILTEVI